MLPFSVTILGSNSAVPAYGRHPSAQIIQIHNDVFLVDCGEGTQMRMSECRVKRSKIKKIFISHLHGDHFFGLIGLVTTYQLNQREEDLTIFGPPELEEIIDVQLRETRKRMNFEIVFKVLNFENPTVLFENDDLTIHSFPLLHGIPCCGFLFQEKPLPRKLLKEKLDQYKIPITVRSAIKRGEDFVADSGAVILNAELTTEPPAPRSYAYCSDTAYFEEVVPFIQNATLLYHESTFLTDHEERADVTKHSTARQAARIAILAKVERLMLGHYSAKYADLTPFLQEAQSVFPQSILSVEGETYDVVKMIDSAQNEGESSF